MCTPALRATRRTYPDAQIDILCEERLKWVLEGNPDISQILSCEKYPGLSDGRRLRKEHYDVVIDLLGMPRTAFLTFLSGAKKRIGFRRSGRTLFYTHPINLPEIHFYSAINKTILLKPLGIETKDHTLQIHPKASDLEIALKLTESLRIKTIPRLVAFSPVSRRD